MLDLVSTKKLKIREPSVALALKFIRLLAGMDPWSKQEDIARAVFGGEFKITVVKSCHAAGKTAIAAAIALAWLLTGPDRIVVTTAPTGRQVRDVLWKEIRRIVNRLRSLGYAVPMPPRAPELRHPTNPDWFAIGFSSNDPVNFQGQHPRGGMLVIMDEAAGIPDQMWDAIKGILTGKHDRLLAIGNPVKAEGKFYEAFKDTHTNKITISAFDTPNIIAGRSVIDGLVTTEWINQIAKPSYGEGSNVWRSRVLGEFPDGDANALVPLAWMEAANERWLSLERWSTVPEPQREDWVLVDDQAQEESKRWRQIIPPVWADAPLHCGLDLARGGANETGMAGSQPQGIRWLKLMDRALVQDAMRNHRIREATVGWVLGMTHDDPRIAELRPDADGIGGDVYDDLYRHFQHNKRRVLVHRMLGGRPAPNPERFFNCRSEWLWALRLALDPSNPAAIAVPPNPRLLGQATNIHFEQTGKGQIRVESKKDMAERLKKKHGTGMENGSPDELDMVAYARAKLGGEMASGPINPDFLKPAPSGPSVWSMY